MREQVIKGYTEKMTPILRQEPLYKAENNDVVGLPIQYLFRPIPREAQASKAVLCSAK
jgi:hypothetical protein